jgi:membrane-bound serine protease (ClpP class)
MLPGFSLAQTQPSTDRSQAQTAAVVIDLSGQIDNFNRDMLLRHFADARKLGAQTVILRIDTWGGLVTAGLDISRFLKRQDDLHVIAYVDEKAISAGAMIALACNEIVMSPYSSLGDCAPITLSTAGSLEPLPAAERAKAESPILADFYDSAVRNHYDPLLAQAMVSVGRVVHWVQNDHGERRFVDAADYEKLKSDGWTTVPGARDPIDGGESLLTVNPDQAIQYGLAKGQAPSVEALARDRNLTIVATLTPGAGEKLIGLLSSTIVRSILTTIFMFALYWSFSHPGHGGPEAVALTTLGLLVGVPLLTGYAQWWEILAIVIGLGLIALEIFVIPGFGITGISGIVLLLGGLMLTWVGNEPSGLPGILPSLQGTRDAMMRGLTIIVIGLACSLFLWVWLQKYLPKLPYVNRLILTATTGNITLTDSDVPGAVEAIVWPPVGSIGAAVTDLRPGGSAEFADSMLNDVRVTDVLCDSGFVRAGTRVVVRESTGTRVVVRPI